MFPLEIQEKCLCVGVDSWEVHPETRQDPMVLSLQLSNGFCKKLTENSSRIVCCSSCLCELFFLCLHPQLLQKQCPTRCVGRGTNICQLSTEGTVDFLALPLLSCTASLQCCDASLCQWGFFLQCGESKQRLVLDAARQKSLYPKIRVVLLTVKLLKFSVITPALA